MEDAKERQISASVSPSNFFVLDSSTLLVFGVVASLGIAVITVAAILVSFQTKKKKEKLFAASSYNSYGTGYDSYDTSYNQLDYGNSQTSDYNSYGYTR
jgi:hypothetical protein